MATGGFQEPVAEGGDRRVGPGEQVGAGVPAAGVALLRRRGSAASRSISASTPRSRGRPRGCGNGRRASGRRGRRAFPWNATLRAHAGRVNHLGHWAQRTCHRTSCRIPALDPGGPPHFLFAATRAARGGAGESTGRRWRSSWASRSSSTSSPTGTCCRRIDAVKNANPAEKKSLVATSRLLLALVLVILICGILLTFRFGRFFLPRQRQPSRPTKYVDAWAESAKRMPTPSASEDDE